MTNYPGTRSIRRLATALAMIVCTFSYGAFAASYDGVIEFDTIIDVHAGVSGRIESTRLVPGIYLSHGDELARIEGDLYQARLDEARSRLEMVQAENDEARKSFERSEILFEEGSLSLVEFDHAQLLVQRAGVSLLQAQGHYLTAHHHAQLSRIQVPFDSVVLDTQVTAGQYVNASVHAPLIGTLAKRGHYAVRVALDATQRMGVQLGDNARVMLNGTEWQAMVGAIRHDPSKTPFSWSMDVVFQSDAVSIVPGIIVQVELP